MLRISLRILVVLTSLFALTVFAASALPLIPRSRTAEPVEKVVLEHAVPIAQYAAMYREPSTPAAPALMPGFPLTLAAVAGDAEPQLWQVRTLGLLATLLAAFLIALIVQMECGSWTLALASGSFALLAQGFLAVAPGIARPETLMLAFVLLGFISLRYTQGIWGAVFGALPLAVAVFIDPEAAWFVGAACVALALEGRGRTFAFVIAAGLLIGGGYVALWRTLGPWFNFNAWDVPLGTLHWSARGPLKFIGDHLLGRLGIWTCVGLLSFAMSAQPWSGKTGIWLWLAVGGLAAGLATTQTRSFGAPSLVPSIVVLSLLGPILLQRVARYLAAWKEPDRPGGEGGVHAAVLLQFAALFAAVPVARWLPNLIGLWQ
jgi:hypothetical protein